MLMIENPYYFVFGIWCYYISYHMEIGLRWRVAYFINITWSLWADAYLDFEELENPHLWKLFAIY